MSTGTIPEGVHVYAQFSGGEFDTSTIDETGRYAIRNLQEGLYDVSISAGGFRPYTQKGVSVSVNVVTRVDAAIQLGGLNEQVTVVA